VIAYPTEAVFGLGCLPLKREAVERLLAIKRRSWRKGLLLIAAELEQLEPFVVLPKDSQRRREILAAWPGPTTWVLEALPGVPRWISGGRRTVGVRVTAHPLARALCERVGQALVSTSANVTNRRPSTTALQVRRALGAKIDHVLAGAVGGLDKPTQIKDGRTGRVLRAA
jgi:L-threonylcarbamoyladenylate synthase